MNTSPDYKQRDHEFGNLIQFYRRKADLTQTQVADRVGVSVRTVKNWDSGVNYPQTAILRQLVAIFLERDCFTQNEEQKEAEFFWEKATYGKKDVKDAFDPVWFNNLLQNQTGPLRPVLLGLIQGQLRQDWSEAVENRVLYGREQVQADLEKWIIKDKQRVVGVFGMGGMGKTGLVVSVAHHLASQFDYVIFRSLHNAPPLGELLDSVLRFLLNGQLNNLPTVQSEKLTLVMEYLRNFRCLLVLDNLETIMQEGLEAGDFREGYTDYADFIRRVSEFAHKSCLLITSREKPRQAAFREAKNGFVRACALVGLDNKSCQAILQSMNVTSDEEQSALFTRHYSGNPLALKLIAEQIRDIFGGDPGAFLNSKVFLYGDGEIRFILDQHFGRLSPVEQDILYWLAVSREPLDVEALQNRSLLQVGTQTFADGLSALFKRYLIEQTENNNKPYDKKNPGFTLQGVVVEYVTQRLLNKLHAEIVSQTLEMLHRYPLFQTGTREYVRQTQLRVLVEPLLHQLKTTLKRDETVNRYFKQLLENLQNLPQNQQGYAGGNLLNLLIHFGTDLSGWNLGGLALWQTNLAGVALHDVNMREADLTGAIFTEANISGFGLAYSPDGKTLAIGCANGAVKLWQVGATFGSQLLECRGHTNLVSTLAFNLDGSILASGCADGTVRLWEPNSGICLAVLDEPTAPVQKVAFSPDGKWLVSGGNEQTIYLWQVSNTQPAARIDGEQGWIMAVAFSPDGKLLASGGFDATIKLWDTGVLLKENNYATPGDDIKIGLLDVLEGVGNWVHSIAFSNDGLHLAASSDKTVRVWSIDRRSKLPKFKLQHTLGGQNGLVTNVRFSPDNKLLAYSGIEGVINLFTLNNPANHKSLPAGIGAIMALAFHPDGETLVSSSAENSNLKPWSLKNYEIQDVLPGYINLIYSVTVSPNGQWLGVTGIDYHLLLWDLTRPYSTEPVVLKGHNGFVFTLAFSPDGKTITSGGGDSTIKLWNLASGICWRTLRSPGKPVTSVVFTSDNRLLISSDEDGNLKLWSLITGECLNIRAAHQRRIRKVIFDPAGQILGSCGEDGAIRLWKIDSKNALICQLNGWPSGSQLVMSLAFNHDGTRLYSASGDGLIRGWDVATGECIFSLSSNQGMLWSIAYSASVGEGSQQLAAIGADGSIQVWQLDQSDKAELLAAFDHGAKGTAVAFNAEGKLLFSGGEGGAVKIWDLAGKELAATLTARPPYEGLNIEDITGLTEAQRLNLLTLGAVESSA